MKKIRAVAVVGPTCSGKSALAMKLAKELSTDIVAMDSMQIYRHMDIGTAKPTREDQEQVRHHMLDIVSPEESFTVADYCDRVLPILRGLSESGKIPLLVGGTGLYLKALMDGMRLGGVSESPQLRRELNQMAQEENGCLLLHERLSQIDPESAARLHPHDIRRVIRAIEIYELTGKPSSQVNRTLGEGEADILPIAIRTDRKQLYGKLEVRIDQMLRDGLLAEVKSLCDMGLSSEMQSMQGIGYKELVPVVKGEISLEEGRRHQILDTRHYAKRQETWFRGDERTVWLEADDTLFDNSLKLIQNWMQREET